MNKSEILNVKYNIQIERIVIQQSITFLNFIHYSNQILLPKEWQIKEMSEMEISNYKIIQEVKIKRRIICNV